MQFCHQNGDTLLALRFGGELWRNNLSLTAKVISIMLNTSIENFSIALVFTTFDLR